MSSEGDTGGQPSTTAISTVAVQAGDSQIVVAVLKCGELVNLRLVEAEPDLLEIGGNQEETRGLLNEHEQLLTKLKKHEGAVWSLLEKADETAEEKVGEEEVHEAMADSLAWAWKCLVSRLEMRRTLLILASEFFDRALEFAIKIDKAEDFQRTGPELTDSDSLSELLQKHSSIKRGLLETSMLVLTKSEELLEFLMDLQREEVLSNGSGGGVGAHRSRARVERLMEILQDRRRQLDLHMRKQRHHLELIQSICQWERQEEEVTLWLKENADLFLENNHLGSSLSENENLLQDYRDFELKAKDWDSLVERLLAQASDLAATEDCGARERLAERRRRLKDLQEHLWSRMMDQLARLQESNDVFRSANKAFEVLGNVQSCLKGLRTQTLPLPELAKKHEELHRTIREAASDPLQRGQLLLQQCGSQSAQVGGLQRMLGYIQERVMALTQECHAHRELATNRQQLVASFEELADKISAWLRSSSNILSGCTDPGSCLSEAAGVLHKHLELASNTQDSMRDVESAAALVQDLKVMEAPDAVDFSSRISLQAEELKNLTRNLTARIETLRPYNGFLSSAEKVEEQVKALQEFYKERQQEEEENEEAVGAVKEVIDAKWQSLLEALLTLQDLANNFINHSNMVSENLNLDVKAAVCVVEMTMDSLNKKKSELSDMWTSWQLHFNQMKSVKKQWKKMKDQVKKIVHDLKTIEDVLVPKSKVDLGSDLLTVSKLQENFDVAKPQFLQLNAEVELLVKTSEMLAVKGIPVKEKNEKITELLQVHQRVKDQIKEYGTVLSMAVKFHQSFQELDALLQTVPVTAFSDTGQAQTQLTQHRDRQSHVRHLSKLAVSLGADISSTVHQSRALGLSVCQLQEKLQGLERCSASWTAEAIEREENLTSNVHYCLFKEEISELRESFKDLKKKFNNSKFNYMKKNEKLRNSKAVKNQIQQTEIYIEKLQVLKKKFQMFTLKLSSSSERPLIGGSPREVEDAVNELQRQLGDFDRMVEEHKQNLDMTVKLQQAMEEYQFWCDEASATIVRVGKYSSQCKTKEAVSCLYKQFEKFVWPTIPQQEERISQITELAERLHGAEEGKKYVEKTVNKHSEIVESIKELCNGLLDLEAKLQMAEAMNQSLSKEPDLLIQMEKSKGTFDENKTQDTLEASEPKETGHTPEMVSPGAEKEESQRQESKKPHLRKTKSYDLLDKDHQEHLKVLSETRSFTQEAYTKTVETITRKETVERKQQLHASFTHTHTFSMSSSPVERDRKINVLHQPKSESLDTPPPPSSTAPSFSDIKRAFQGRENLGPPPSTHHDKTQVFSEAQPPHTGIKSEAAHPGEYEGITDPASAAGAQLDGDMQQELLTEESVSNDEYECTSPDDISLPPLSETPESNLVQSENDLDDGCCASAHSLNQPSLQHQQSSHPQPGDAAPHRRDWPSSRAESYPSPTSGLGTKFRAKSSSFVHSPLTVPAPSLVSSTISNILKNKPLPVACTLSERHQTVYSLHESRTEVQECVHDPDWARGSGPGADNTHVTLNPVTTEQDPDLVKPTAFREEIRLPSSIRAMGNLAGQGPNFSKALSNATVMEGSPVTLEVEVTGFPEPTLTWYKNGQTLTNDERVQLSQKEGKCALFIQRAAGRDTALYVACAANSSGSVSSSATLQVKVRGAASHSLSWMRDQGPLTGEDDSLGWSIEAIPQPHELCFKDRDTLPTAETNVPNQSELHVLKRSVVLSESAECVCMVKNEEAEKQGSIWVNVREREIQEELHTKTIKKANQCDKNPENIDDHTLLLPLRSKAAEMGQEHGTLMLEETKQQ